VVPGALVLGGAPAGELLDVAPQPVSSSEPSSSAAKMRRPECIGAVVGAAGVGRSRAIGA
jgi:hypothetical protein